MRTVEMKLKSLVIASAVTGFLLIPLHELGHVICDWITGNPAAMSYARDYLLSGKETPLLGVLGGPLLPIVVAAVAMILVFRGRNVSVFYPVALLGSIERLVFYVAGMLPSDERSLATMAGWGARSFMFIFLGCELTLLLLLAVSFITNRMPVKKIAAAVLVPLAGFVAGAAFGIFVVERYVFPLQYALQFGH